MKNLLPIVFCSVLSITACSGGGAAADTPTADAAEEAFLASDIYRREFSEGIVRLRNFEKTNGQTGELGGVRIYTLFFEAEIEYLKDDPKLKDVFGGYTNDSLNEVLIRCRLDETKSGPRCRDRKAGDIAKISGELVFEETENGWVSSSESITGSVEAATSSGRQLSEATPAGDDSSASSSRQGGQDQGRSTAATPNTQAPPDIEEVRDGILGAWGAADGRIRVALVFAEGNDLTIFRAVEGNPPQQRTAHYRFVDSKTLEIRSYNADGSLGNPRPREISINGDSLHLGFDDEYQRIGNLNEFLNLGGSGAPEDRRTRNRPPAVSEGSGLVLLYSVPPEYPARAKSRGIEGEVRVQFSVDANGKPTDAIVVTSSSSIFEKAAIAHILERRYEPSGRAIAGLTEEISFKLD